MEAHGFGAADVLEGSGIDAEQLRRPGYLLDVLQYQAVVTNMIRLTGNQGIGLEVGAATDLTDFGIVGHAMISSSTARDAIHLWLRYSNALVGMLVTMRLDEHEDAWSLTLSEIRPMGFLHNFAAEELLVLAVKLGGALTRTRVHPTELELAYPAPAHLSQYEDHLHCTPRFNCRRTRISFDAPKLSLPLRGSDEEFNSICLQHCNQMLKQINGESPIASRVRSLLLGRMQGVPAIDELAIELGLSERTLRRRLQEEGYTYRDLVLGFRVELAKEYLGHSQLTAKETAYLLGFKDSNAFRRAFKLWTGQTIHEFREHAVHGSSSLERTGK